MMYLFKEKGRLFKSGQVSIFVIIAIVLVGGLLTFFAFKGYFSFSEVPSELRPVYDYYSECIKEELEIAVDVSGTQGGRIFIDDYVPGINERRTIEDSLIVSARKVESDSINNGERLREVIKG